VISNDFLFRIFLTSLITRMKDKIVNFAVKTANEADINTRSAPALSFSIAARFLPDGRYVPSWLYDRALQIEAKVEAEAQKVESQVDETKPFHYPQLQIDILRANQTARDNLRGTTARSSRPPTAPSHRDPRFPTQPLNTELGPGVYSLSPTFTAADEKESSPFTRKKRLELFGGEKPAVAYGAAHHLLTYVEPLDVGKHLEKHGPKINLNNSNLPHRASVEDYSYSTRFSQAGKGLPPEPLTGSLRMDTAGRLLNISDKALSHRSGAIPFESKSKKLDCYPIPASEHGPGSYTPYTSIGGNGKSKSYRLNANPRIPGQDIIGPSSPSFISTARTPSCGPISIHTDSSMRRNF
jgi:hypothetical protein